MKVINLEDFRHSTRVANLSIDIAKNINLSNGAVNSLYISSLFHDVGKAFLNQSILNKKGDLTSIEKKHIQGHALCGYKELLRLGYPEDVALTVLFHHENWDGTGYPIGLKGNYIPIASRILKISDVFDALVSDRPYRKKLSVNEALLIMDSEREHFDPEIFKFFQNTIKQDANFAYVFK